MVHGARIGIFSTTISVDNTSAIDASGMGCGGGLGLGKGMKDDNIGKFCPGSGGSYGGVGGPGISTLSNN